LARKLPSPLIKNDRFGSMLFFMDVKESLQGKQ
jgi:hypothetical protein